MTKFSIPDGPVKKILDIDNFNGVDFTSKIPDISRSDNALNIIKRNGYHQIRKPFVQYNVSKANRGISEVVGLGTNMSGAKFIINPTNNPEVLTNAEFKERYPNFEDGKIVAGNELGAMLIERNNDYKYGLFIVGPPSIDNTEWSAMGYEISKNLLNHNATNATINGITFSVNDDGTIHVSGTATEQAGLELAANLQLSPGRYTLSDGVMSNDLYLSCVINGFNQDDPDYDRFDILYTSNTGQVSFELGEHDKIYINVLVKKDATVDYTLKPQLEEGDVATEYTPYIDDPDYIPLGNVSFTLLPYTVDQWANPITIFDERYNNFIYKISNEIQGERIPKLVDKITGELWEETTTGYNKTNDEHEMYLKISSLTMMDVGFHQDYFQVFESASLLGNASSELSFSTDDIDLENKPLDYYKKIIFNDKPYYFTTTGIRTVTAKMIKKLNGAITIEISCDVIGSDTLPAKTPLYRIGCNPGLTEFTQNEDINLINHMVEVGYRGDGVSTYYKLLTDDYVYDDKIRVKIMQNDGTWVEYVENTGMFTKNGNYVIFNTAPDKTPLDGYDNVIIKQRYSVKLNHKKLTYDRKINFEQNNLDDNIKIVETISDIDHAKDAYIIADGKIIRPDDTVENPYPNGKAWYWENIDSTNTRIYLYRNLSVCPTQALIVSDEYYSDLTEEEYAITRNVENVIVYGNENENRVFINGDKNIQVYSDANDITYWPDTNYNVIGDESAITGFGLNNGYLLTFKKGSNSIFIQQGATIGDKSTFPVIYSQNSENILSSPIQLDDRLFIFTTNGLEEISYSTNMLAFINRSYFINKKLKEVDFDTITWFKWDANLYIMFRDKKWAETHIFVADLDDNARVYEKSSSVGDSFSTGMNYQYEWYYLKTVFSPLIITDYTWENNGTEYNLAYNNDGLYEISNDESAPRIDQELIVIDKVVYGHNNGIKSYWETPFIDMDDIIKAKTIRGVYVNTKGMIGDKLIVFSKTIDDGYNKIGEINYLNYNIQNDFPKRAYIKDKIRKFMNVKYLLTNDENYDKPWIIESSNFSFNRLSFEYQDAGKYRGE